MIEAIVADQDDHLFMRFRLGQAYFSAGRFEDAVRTWERLLPEIEQSVGADHVNAKSIRVELAKARQQQAAP
jgi:cytochrome c-type biogenesis protein CcmH/NrfG